MKKPQIDETKLPEVMEIISKAVSLMEEKESQSELEDLQRRLQALTGNKKIRISDYQYYYSYTNLETVARGALYLPPQKSNLTDEQIAEIIRAIADVKVGEAEMDYFLKVLEVETGLDDISDYIFYPDLKGLNMQASVDEIIEKVMADKKD